jgi:carbamoyl-phosphate synthase/aspartate carbamoyltransferase
MYINLPSKNRFRRPANYISQGYKTRRMAVDFAIPLITDVKCAKLLAAALVRKLPLDVSQVDSKSSHATHLLPGFVNIASFVSNLTEAGTTAIQTSTKASIGAGFTTSLFLPISAENSIADKRSLEHAQANATSKSSGNYAFGVMASASNITTLDEEVQTDIKFLFLAFRGKSTAISIPDAAAHFAAWPKDKLIVTDAEGSDLASVLLLASLHARSLHVTGVRNKDDIQLISLSKARHLQVTFDVPIYALFFTRQDFPNAPALPTKQDQDVIWQNMKIVDAFSVGALPYDVQKEIHGYASTVAGLEETVPLLFSAVTERRLTLEDVVKRLHDNPVAIFNLPDQAHTHVEVTVGRKIPFLRSDGSWSPLNGRKVSGSIHRVIVHDQTVYLDGSSISSPPGRDISSVAVSHGRLDKALTVPKVDATDSSLLFSPAPGAPVVAPGLLSASNSLTTVPPLLPMQPHPAFHRRHILSVKQFTQRDLYDLFAVAHEMRLQVERNGRLDILKGRVLCSLFYEPSTRTSASFDAAMKRCGGEVISVNATHSSVTKGESLADTIRTLGCYADAVVIRHPDEGSSQLAAKFSPVPIINAGDGIGEHPTQVRDYWIVFRIRSDVKSQALLDIYTIRSELGTLNGRTITLLGDLKNGRTVHSLVTLLCLYSVRLNFISPASLKMPTSVVTAARKAGVHVHQGESLEEVLGETDVLYVTRVQRERFASAEEWAAVEGSYRVDHALLARAKEDMIVMHPLPRVNEIDPEVDYDSRRAVYFRQMRYGLFVSWLECAFFPTKSHADRPCIQVRMALLASVIG